MTAAGTDRTWRATDSRTRWIVARELAPVHIHTPVYRQGTVDAGGGLDGNLILILVASGDMSMGGRVNPDGSHAITDLDHNEANAPGDAELTAPDSLAGYKALASQIKASGITRVRGDVVIDERLWAPLDFREQFQVSPICVDDNLIDVAITPGAVGAAANVVARPLSAALRMASTLMTAAAGSLIDVSLTPRRCRAASAHRLASGPRPARPRSTWSAR